MNKTAGTRFCESPSAHTQVIRMQDGSTMTILYIHGDNAAIIDTTFVSDQNIRQAYFKKVDKYSKKL